jgi:hypothetical protein
MTSNSVEDIKDTPFCTKMLASSIDSSVRVKREEPWLRQIKQKRSNLLEPLMFRDMLSELRYDIAGLFEYHAPQNIATEQSGIGGNTATHLYLVTGSNTTSSEPRILRKTGSYMLACLTRGLRTNRHTGLSIDETDLNGTVKLVAVLLHNWPELLGIAFAAYLISNRFNHGLNKYPGPFLASLTNWWRFWIVYKRRPEVEHIRLHAKHGDVVRLGPNCLSFSDPKALKTIYGLNKGFTKVNE